MKIEAVLILSNTRAGGVGYSARQVAVVGKDISLADADALIKAQKATPTDKPAGKTADKPKARKASDASD